MCNVFTSRVRNKENDESVFYLNAGKTGNEPKEI